MEQDWQLDLSLELDMFHGTITVVVTIGILELSWRQFCRHWWNRKLLGKTNQCQNTTKLNKAHTVTRFSAMYGVMYSIMIASHDDVSNHRPLDCLLNSLFNKADSKENIKFPHYPFVKGIHRIPHTKGQ